MMTVGLEDYSYLWDGSEPVWVLYVTGEDRYVPYNEETQMALIIEDDDEFQQVTDRMKASGVRIVDREH
jgi:hypothetical protein